MKRIQTMLKNLKKKNQKKRASKTVINQTIVKVARVKGTKQVERRIDSNKTLKNIEIN